MNSMQFRPHGGVRGANVPRGSLLFEGSFGRIFRTLLEAQFSDDALIKLATRMTAKPEEEITPETKDDAEENQGIAAGYTYLGQFIDHDLTFDPMSSLQKENDPDALTNFRTPRFDLDCLYGRGPDDQPYLYEDDGLRFKLGRKLSGSDFDPNTRDLPRHVSVEGSRARALIGDPRNDQTVIIAQLHAIMLRFHNRIVSSMGKGLSFAQVQRLVRWHYQWVVLDDFLKTIVGEDMVYRILPHLKKGTSIYDDKPNLQFFKWRYEPYIPIEFAAAAYRFGHSMVRPVYRLNTNLKSGGPEDNGRRFIFTPDDGPNGLNGFREFPSEWAVDWRLFFNIREKPPQTGIERVQKAYKIDSSLVDPLGMLPKVIAKDVRSLAERNLRRGRSMGLPSGQDVARYMDIKPIAKEKLRVGKATKEDMKDKKKTPLLTEISAEFAENAPLWYYVLAEAQQQFDGEDNTPIRLGDVGGRIVAEAFIGLLLGDSHSFLSQDPSWQPKFKNDKGKFGMAELIQEATKA
jgi:heme peroxidase